MELLTSLMSTLRTVDPGTLDQEYNVVRSQTLLLKRDPSFTTENGALKENIKKNRYKDILPYDQSRVVLSLLTSDLDSDYINASFIKGVASDSKYIACQAPLSSSVTDFWRMIWQHDIKVIVMACREIEMGKKKCECYWSHVHQSAAFGPFTVCNGETRPNEDMVVRDLTVTYQKESRAVTQYQFLSWPDHDVPYEAAGVLDLLEKARDSQGTHTSPLLIHCSAGCGRTGVICALDYIYDLLITKQILTTDFSIMKIVLELRKQRPSSVQTKEQYQFIFSAAACMFERVLQSPSGRQLLCNLSQVKHTKRVCVDVCMQMKGC
ncbi:tyrosine-protein phosphatase non-receptor type 18 isoform X2 [Cottoperca gobio]|uniref:protein-tyrosine-phosphatase n=1 Tax=Cottoperca gobio TaxID=56716 RepID=A0A6J2Q378_COTGO|nr:tyrosine-protein phosphatase non-receptor type 18-like isoform X2 [Cottoperca gobio]